MIHFFKNKTAIKKEYYRKGLDDQKKKSDRQWSKKFNHLKQEAKKIREKKNRQIKKQDERVQAIEDKLEMFMLTLADARLFAIEFQAEKQAEHNRISEQYREIYSQTDSLISLFRTASKRSDKLQKTIEQYHLETVQ